MENYNKQLNQIHETLLRVFFGSKEVLSLDEASQFTGLSKSFLYKLTSARKITFSCPNGKLIFFQKKDLNDFLVSNPVTAADDIDQYAIDYVTNNPLKGGKWA